MSTLREPEPTNIMPLLSWLHLKPRTWSMWFIFIPWQSDLCLWDIAYLRYLAWKFKDRVTTWIKKNLHTHAMYKSGTQILLQIKQTQKVARKLLRIVTGLKTLRHHSRIGVNFWNPLEWFGLGLLDYAGTMPIIYIGRKTNGAVQCCG